MLELPRACFLVEDEVVEFATEVIEACDEAGRLEASLVHSNGRPRALGARVRSSSPCWSWRWTAGRSISQK